MSNNKKYNWVRILEIIVISGSIIGYITWTLLDKDDVRNLKKNHTFSIGKLISYSSSGAPESFSLKYLYQVDGKSFDRSIHAPFEKFPGCEHDFSLCSDKEFWVAYEKDNPSNSLINLDIEIQGIEDPVPPKNLDGFR